MENFIDLSVVVGGGEVSHMRTVTSLSVNEG